MKHLLAAVVDEYGFELSEEGANLIVVADTVEGGKTDWFEYTISSEVITLLGDTKAINIWLNKTRPELTRVKLNQFISDLNEIFELSNIDPILREDLISSHDWDVIKEM